MILKRQLEKKLKSIFLQVPVVTLIGPRKSVKSKLVRYCFAQLVYVNQEAPEFRRLVSEDPKAFLTKYENGATLDEIQNTPELLSFICVLVDQKNQSSHFELTSIYQLALHEAILQSLAVYTRSIVYFIKVTAVF
jgi:predicted AAA+ superfamily ATPase